MNISKDEETLKNNCPHIVVGTPGRILALVKSKKLNLKHLKHFILDECDKMLESLDMRRDVQEIFRSTPHEKQVMMFSATLSKEIRAVCKKFMLDPMEVYVDNEAKLTLHGLQQHYVKIQEKEKNRKLFELLDALEFNQVVVFVKSVQRCMALSQLLVDQNFPAIGIHRAMTQEAFGQHIQSISGTLGWPSTLVVLPLFSLGTLTNSTIETEEWHALFPCKNILQEFLGTFHAHALQPFHCGMSVLEADPEVTLTSDRRLTGILRLCAEVSHCTYLLFGLTKLLLL